RCRRVRHHRDRGQGLRPPEGPYRTVSRRRICGRFPAQGEAGRRRIRRPGRPGGGSVRRCRTDRPHRRRQDLRVHQRHPIAHPHRRARRRGDLAGPLEERGRPQNTNGNRHRRSWQAHQETTNMFGGMKPMSSAKDVVKQIKDQEIEWVDLRFTDPKGKWQHLQMCAGVMDEDALEDGLMFDGSSIEGWKAINESDMILKPDLSQPYIDPFSATPMMVLFCDIVEPSDGQYYSRDPRSTAKRAEAYLKSTGIGDAVYVGPEPEFFMFDDVRFYDGYNGSGYKLD